MRRKIVVVAAVLTGAWLLIMGAPPSLVLPPTERAHYETLCNTESFSGRAIGIAAVEPPESRAFMALAAHPRGGSAFKYLLLRGTMAGRIYALVGLRRTNPAFFSVAVQPFRLWPGNVATTFGCVVSSSPVKTVVDSDEPLDVIDGGYTTLFFEWEALTRPLT